MSTGEMQVFLAVGPNQGQCQRMSIQPEVRHLVNSPPGSRGQMVTLRGVVAAITRTLVADKLGFPG